MIQCQGCTCAGWLWEAEGGLGDHQPGVYMPLKALFLVFVCVCGVCVWGGVIYNMMPCSPPFPGDLIKNFASIFMS